MDKYLDLPAHKQVFQIPSFSSLLFALKMACIESRNQPIYQALMEKDSSQYKIVAQSLLTYDSDLFWCYNTMCHDMIPFITGDNPLDGCTQHIAEYIFQYVKALSSKQIISD